MKIIKKGLLFLFSFPSPFFKVYTPLWLLSCLVLVSLDLGTKKLMTDKLNFHLNYQQFEQLSLSGEESPLALAGSKNKDGRDQIDILGDAGKYIKLRLVFNDRFVFGIGPALPYLGFFLSLAATVFLVLYRWRNFNLGHPAAWLLVFSGAMGNLIDKLFIKSIHTREWIFSLAPQKGYVSGVADFVECIWFGWQSLEGYFLLRILSMETWPTFNLADSMIVVGIILLLLTMQSSLKKKYK